MDERISNAGEVVEAIRRGLREHASAITVTFDYGSDIFEEVSGVVDRWVEAALAETENPAEGDYIRYQYGGYMYNCSDTYDGRWHYTVELIPDYYTYPSQERQVTEEVQRLLGEFAFTGHTSDYGKIAAIYDYLCSTVAYDKVHRKNPHAHLKSTAYAALIRHSATCQGYCAALYRLLREAGINCRIITGAVEGKETLHAWVIAELGGLYYGLDPTWDAGREEYGLFLLGREDFADHIPAKHFQNDEFSARYPMAEASYVKEGSK